MNLRSSRPGFTLIELLLVIGIIAIIAAIIVVAMNPSKQRADSRNGQRRSDIVTILSAITQYSAEHKGALPSTITSTPTFICRSGRFVNCTGLISLSALTGSYLISLPTDPTAATATSTAYTIMRSGSRITVAAPSAEQGASISMTK